MKTNRKALLVKIIQEVHELANNAKKHSSVQPRRGEKSWILKITFLNKRKLNNLRKRINPEMGLKKRTASLTTLIK